MLLASVRLQLAHGSRSVTDSADPPPVSYAQFNYGWLSGEDSPEACSGCHNQSCVNSIGDPCWNSSGTHFTDMNLALQTEFATQWNYPWCAY